MAEGKTSWGTLRGYYEADWLGTGITSNNNQSNSYVLRQRVVWGQAETNSHWAFTGGQLWSLATEDKKGISNFSGDILTPQTIDPNYVTGFVWTRQYGFRITKTFEHAAFGIAAENPQLLYTASLAGNEPYAVLGSAGTNGGNYNAAVSTCSPSTTIVNYTNQKETDSAGNTIDVAVPVYKTVNGCSDIATISFNQAPDIIAKAAFDPGWGHYEIFGIGGFAHETVYPGETTNSNLYGGLKDIATGAAVAPALTTAGYLNNSIKVGGLGGSLRVPVIPNILTFGAKGLFGPGVGRYGDSTLADVTADSSGYLRGIHNVSGLFTVEATPTPRLSLYLNYGGDYAGRADYGVAGATTSLGAPSADFCPTTAGAFPCTTTPTAAQVLAPGADTGAHPATPLSVTAPGSSPTPPALPPQPPAITAAVLPATSPAAPAAHSPATCRKSPVAGGMTFTRVSTAASARASSMATRFVKVGQALPASAPRASTTCSGPPSVTTSPKPRSNCFQQQEGSPQPGLPFSFLPA
jgi:hypothetical protein